jgi:hypothetical protein
MRLRIKSLHNKIESILIIKEITSVLVDINTINSHLKLLKINDIDFIDDAEDGINDISDITLIELDNEILYQKPLNNALSNISYQNQVICE